ncbi:MAG: hypothetical protein KF730_08575 [Sphingomonas sp.]|uniref:hypothetical protein n=1 Tax=Sphingomonas sp. TaxID=28214 RepID=UPI0025F5C949|nr:hypothetical protein [Sphingomonas sp.]MBX3564614.1 hypothetical protein [Sphingomonas sp.]
MPPLEILVQIPLPIAVTIVFLMGLMWLLPWCVKSVWRCTEWKSRSLWMSLIAVMLSVGVVGTAYAWGALERHFGITDSREAKVLLDGNWGGADFGCNKDIYRRYQIDLHRRILTVTHMGKGQARSQILYVIGDTIGGTVFARAPDSDVTFSVSKDGRSMEMHSVAQNEYETLIRCQ